MADPESLHDNPRSPKGFKKKPNKKIDGREYEHIDPSRIGAPLSREDAEPAYISRPDSTSNLPHEEKNDKGEREYWKPVAEEKPTS
jgi:hypothetical protein